MTSVAEAPVVVGVDGSESSLDGVRLAAREAALRGRHLRVVHALVWAQVPVPLGPDPSGPPEGGLRNDAMRVVARAIEEARETEPDVDVDGEVVEGGAAAVLIGQARGAALLVLGSRGLGGFTGLLMGSVAVQVASYATCPVLVARGGQQSDGPVVVGLDGSQLSAHALAFAYEEASLRVCELVALHAYTYPPSGDVVDEMPLVYDEEDVAAGEGVRLGVETTGWAERYPDVPLTRRLVRAKPARALVDESRQARLVVVGARGRGGFTGLLLGSVSQAVLHHARCPVAVVRA